ncbi:MAG: hypothetical protein JO222_14550 [Frankiales bacterium]|nr:hypothetical protein [Frankiales bacterium]
MASSLGVRRALQRSWLLFAAFVAVLAEFLPWFDVRFGVFLASGHGTRVRSASAWAASTWWSAGLLLTAVAALFRFWALRGVRSHRWCLAAAAAAIAGSVALAVQWWDLGPGAGPTYRTTGIRVGPAGQLDQPDLPDDTIGQIHRDRLLVISERGFHSGPTCMAAASSCAVAAFTLWAGVTAGSRRTAGGSST